MCLFCEFKLLREFRESMGSAVTGWGLTVNLSSGVEKSCILYSWFCLFMIIIIISIFFVVLLNCLTP